MISEIGDESDQEEIDDVVVVHCQGKIYDLVCFPDQMKIEDAREPQSIDSSNGNRETRGNQTLEMDDPPVEEGLFFFVL